MIFDYLIDFNYLATAAASLESGDPALDNFRRIIDACIRPEENGRLVMDSDRKSLRPLLMVEFPPSRLGQRMRYIVEEKFLRAIPASRFGGRRLVGVTQPVRELCVRDIPVFDRNAGRITKALISIDPPPAVVITDQEITNDIAFVSLSDDMVFDAVDEERGKLKLERTITLSEKHSGLPLPDFWSFLHVFGAAEEAGFSIYDPYGFDENNGGKRESLIRWIAHLLGANNPHRRTVRVRIFSRCGVNDYVNGKPNDLDVQFRRLKTRIADGDGLPHFKAIALELEFGFVVDDDKDLDVAAFKKDVQHDRYICSSTHYFGVGSGIDSIGFRETFHVQYKGRVCPGDSIPQLDELRSFYDDQMNLKNGRVRTFSCRI